MKKNVKAYVINTKSQFADITARAMLRTPILGVGALGLLEISDIVHEVANGKNFYEEMVKSITKFVTTLVATGVFGALGAKHYGAIGSLTGTTFGALTGVIIDNVIN